ncbi:MAG: hypothetical protein ACLP9S_13045 [Syntrophales bacterium]
MKKEIKGLQLSGSKETHLGTVHYIKVSLRKQSDAFSFFPPVFDFSNRSFRA